MKAFNFLVFAIYIIVFFGPLAQADERIRVKYWQSKDKHEVILLFPEKKETYYFNNDSSRLCFSFKVAGLWYPTGVRGLLGIEKRHAVIGVLVFNKHDLRDFRGKTLLERATNRQAYIYYHQSGIPPKTSLQAFSSSYPDAFKWTASWQTEFKGEKVIAKAIKYFVVLGDRWIIQVTTGHQSGGDATARAVIDSLRTTANPRCYWPAIRKFTSDRIK